MFILLTIFLLIFTPLVMVVIHLVRPKFSIQGFLIVLAVLTGLVMVLIAKPDNPQVISLLAWAPVSLFSISPSLLIDRISWYFSLALVSLSLSAIITSIAELGQSLKPGQILANPMSDPEAQDFSTDGKFPGLNTIDHVTSTVSNWQSWAGMAVLTSLGLVAVTAGNMLTLLLAWAALDVIELLILLAQVLDSKTRERIVLAFTARMAGIGTVLLAGIIPWSHGQSLLFENFSQSTSLYLLLAAGLRLGVLPLYLPYVQVLTPRRGLRTILRLVPAASSYILLVRVASVGILGVSTPYLFGLTALVGLFAAINWIRARDELTGRPFWLLGTASLAVAAAIVNQPAACIAWSIASVLSGGLVFSMSMRHKNLVPIALLGLINFSALPFSPTWMGTTLYQYTSELSPSISPLLHRLISTVFIFSQALLLAGLIRHTLRGIFPTEVQTGEHIERWVWFLYPLGLVFIIATHFFIGYWLYPNLREATFIEWIIGPVTVIFSGIIHYVMWRYPHMLPQTGLTIKTSTTNPILSLDWFYRFFWYLYRLFARLIGLFSTILEGDGGILWALVLFALIFVFLQK